MGRRAVRGRPGRPGVLLSLFVAVFPDEDARQHLKRHLPVGVRPEKWHVTLAFLGPARSPAAHTPTDDDRAIDIARALTELPPPGAITLRLAGGGRFGSVLWAGLAGDVERLATFREDMRSTLVKAGFALDERPFRPHLTVSYRFHRGIDQALRDYAGPLWQVDGFSLVLSQAGEYHRIHTWPTHQPAFGPPGSEHS